MVWFIFFANLLDEPQQTKTIEKEEDTQVPFLMTEDEDQQKYPERKFVSFSFWLFF